MSSNRPRILIVYPPASGARPGIRGIYFPLGIAYIASAIRADYDVKVHDFNYDLCLDGENPRGKMEDLLGNGDHDLLMIGGVFPKYGFIKDVIETSRRLSPDVKIILGGSHLKPALNVTAEYCEADYYVVGEGEEVIGDLLNAVLNNSPVNHISGIAYHDGGNVVLTGDPIPVENLDNVRFPARDLFNFHHYKRYFAVGYPPAYTAYMISSRGCPLNCIFCNPAFGRKVRVRSPENILEEVLLLQREYNCNFMYFHDEVLLGGMKKHVLAFCDEVLSKGYKFFWGGTTNPQMLNNETLDLMRRAGCIKISLGIESGSPRILKEMRKNNDLDRIKEIVAHCNKIGIEIDFSLLTNTFSETEETLAETKEYLASFNRYFLRQPFSLNYLLPVPGTDIYEMAKAKGFLSQNDLSNIMELDDSSRYKLAHNLTQLDSDRFIRIVDALNKDLADEYNRKHPAHNTLRKYTNLSHIRWRGTFELLVPNGIRPFVEALLWALCRGNENSRLGRLYRRMVYANR